MSIWAIAVIAVMTYLFIGWAITVTIVAFRKNHGIVDAADAMACNLLWPLILLFLVVEAMKSDGCMRFLGRIWGLK